MARSGLLKHPKFLRLVHVLQEPQAHVLGYLEMLWHVAYETGTDRLGDQTDVELAAGFPGKAGALCAALVECRFIEVRDGKFHVHDLYDHAPEYVQKRMRAQESAEKRRKQLGTSCSAQKSAEVGPPPRIPPPPNPTQPNLTQEEQQQQQDPLSTGSSVSSALSCPPEAGHMNGIAAVAAAADLSPFVTELVKRGLSHALAGRLASAIADPALLREVLAYHQHRVAQGTLDSPVGSLRDMLKNPAGWCFRKTETGWEWPLDDKPRKTRRREIKET